jgi:hypothetical protein
MLDSNAAAERLGISVWALWRLVREDRIPYYRWHRGPLRFDGFELELWKQQHAGGLGRPPMKVRARDISK